MAEKDRSGIIESLRWNLGEIYGLLEEPDLLEVMLNPDGSLWVERFGRSMERIGAMPEERSRVIISQVASWLDTLATVEKPVVEGELPLHGERFEGLLPPLVSKPSFTIRLKPRRIFTLEEYVEASIMPARVPEILVQALRERRNILVVGGTGSGKTTLINAIIHKLSELLPDDRLAIIEDTAELQCSSPNVVTLHTSEYVGMSGLLRATMRLRPDRILVGEVRGPEALTLLDSWNTGHPGGMATVHANSAYGGLIRLEQLIAQATLAPMQALISEAVNLVLFIQRRPEGRRVTQAILVHGYDHERKLYKTEDLYAL
ncbi:MAG: P-type conjugative transfer ATPase TrbB [Deltaproteobacteria bacterium]|jgi:type IV secretion system protein VirB11|nr:P-type conjugative transfer ATPase TrbB [Deltaproteobacteria bacterium]